MHLTIYYANLRFCQNVDFSSLSLKLSANLLLDLYFKNEPLCF